MEKTPDRQIQEAIAGIFRKFRELGGVRQVLLWYRDEKLLIPALSRESGNRKVVWTEAVYPRIFSILKNLTSRAGRLRRGLSASSFPLAIAPGDFHADPCR
jgi:hypothetical protein